MLTDPKDFPNQTGIDKRDENHPNFPRKVIKVFLNPLMRKIIDKEMWLEAVAVIMIFFTGCGELIGRQFSLGWYVILALILLTVGLKIFRDEFRLKPDADEASLQ